MSLDIQHNLILLREQIAACEKKYGRTPGTVKLIAASKSQSIQKISQAITAGQMCFGENYLQEALTKINHFAETKLEWHFIGLIQRNKTKNIAAHFDWVHSVDSPLIAKRLNDQRPAGLPPLNICLEINVSNENSKFGLNIADYAAISELAVYCSSLSNIYLRGLMAIPAAKKSFTEQRTEFHQLTDVYNKLRENGILLDTLSMGMSEDWEAAIAEGATMIRIGTKIFGPRI